MLLLTTLIFLVKFFTSSTFSQICCEILQVQLFPLSSPENICFRLICSVGTPILPQIPRITKSWLKIVEMRWFKGGFCSFLETFQLRRLLTVASGNNQCIIQKSVRNCSILRRTIIEEKMDQFSQFLTLCSLLAFVNWRPPRKLLFIAMVISETHLYLYFYRNTFPFGWAPLGLGICLRLLGLDILYISERNECLPHFLTQEDCRAFF